MAEFVMKDMVKKQGLAEQFYIASAATSTEEIGNPVHYGVRNKLAQLGISTAGKYAVRMERRDYQKYDYIVGMDNLLDDLRIIRPLFYIMCALGNSNPLFYKASKISEITFSPLFFTFIL